MGKNILVAQSGGPTVAINASLAGVIERALECDEIDVIYGGLNGIEGILKKKLVNLSEICNTKEDIFKLSCTPSMALGSCRLKMKSFAETPDVYEGLFEVFEKYNIGYFFYIGGNDSMDTVAKVSEYAVGHNSDVKVIGIPKTIDNDLVMTDHTPGFGSASKYVASSIEEVACDTAVYDKQSVTIIEVMGRDAGWLTASSAVTRVNGGFAPHLIYIPEIPFSKESFVEEVQETLKKYQTVIIATSEGIRKEDGTYANAGENVKTDAFGHVALGGAGKYLEDIIHKEVGCKVRSIELSTLQRSASHSLSKTDIDESVAVGRGAVEFAINGETAVMASIKRVSDVPYKTEIVSVPVSEVANKVRAFPTEWLNDDHSLTEDGMNYFLPLIQGEISLPRKNGLQDFFVIDKNNIV